ncbi:MAG: hypothetical protein NC084_06040 [Bacteroides sp.]|nr:methionine synthase [Eubacterium sp.]MCM1418116.1 methionine synthase [Roseburia sp.]MCM1462260.1 hypothetical protein [Bacteroides sp.]
MTDVKAEALRYLGVRGEADGATLALLDRGVKALDAAVSPSFCWRVEKREDCGAYLVGADIEKHLADCKEVLFFAATLGASADRLIRAAEVENMAYALVLDSLASAMVERYCDECETEMREKTGGFFTARFSPGYGDYPIELQGALLRLLSAEKRIGLTATENHILLPRKSVTAVIGIDREKAPPKKRSCESCNLRDRCDFRRCGGGAVS